MDHKPLPLGLVCRIIMIAALLAVWTPALAEEPPTLEMVSGQSSSLEPGFVVEKIAVGDPEVLGVARTSDSSMLINAKKAGQSNLIVMGAGGVKKEYLIRIRAGALDDDAAALRHAGDFGLLDVVAERDRRLGEDLGGRHDALAADADDEDIGVVAHLRPRIP